MLYLNISDTSENLLEPSILFITKPSVHHQGFQSEVLPDSLTDSKNPPLFFLENTNKYKKYYQTSKMLPNIMVFDYPEICHPWTLCWYLSSTSIVKL